MKNKKDTIDFLDNKTNKKKKKEMNYEKILNILSTIGFFLIPTTISALIISSHSNLLINTYLRLTAIILLFLSVTIIITKLIELLITGNWHHLFKENKKVKITFLILIVLYNICACSCLIIFYGPNKSFRDWLVTTAMATKNHQYYCQWFYSEDEINEVFNNNFITEVVEETNKDLIEFNKEEEAKNEYDKAIFDHEDDAIYKMIRFQVNGCDAYLAVIYDPSKIKVATSKNIGKSGEYVVKMAQRENALVAINGGGFYDPNYSSAGGYPIGVTIKNKEIITNNEYGTYHNGGLVGFTDDNKLVLVKNATAPKALEMNVRDAVSYGPFLIVNGKASYTRGNGGMGYAARTAIGQRSDGIVLLLVVDSNETRTKGASIVDLTEIMQNYGAINASALDGGTSSVMVENGKLISDPIDSTFTHKTRPIPTAFIVTK